MSISNNIIRSEQIANYILEGHSTLEAAREFRVSQTTIERDLKCFAASALDEYRYKGKKINILKAIQIQKLLGFNFYELKPKSNSK